MEYKLVIVKEGGIGSILFGDSKLPKKRIEDELNAHAKDGWRYRDMEIELQRYWLFWRREAAIIVLEREG